MVGSRGGSGFGNSGRNPWEILGRSGHFHSDEILAIFRNLVPVTGAGALSRPPSGLGGPSVQLAGGLRLPCAGAGGLLRRDSGVGSRGARNLGVNNIPSTQIDV